MIFHTPYSSSGTQVTGALLNSSESQAEPHLDSVSFYHTHSDCDNIDTATHLTRTSLGHGRTRKSPGKTLTDMGRRHELHTDRQWLWPGIKFFFLINVKQNDIEQNVI